MDDPSVRVAVLDAELRAHVKSDDERYVRIDTNMEKIASAVASFGDRLEKGFERSHMRIEEEAAKARHNLNNQIQVTNGLVYEAKKEAAAAVDLVEVAVSVVAKSVHELERGGRNYIERGLIFAIGCALASIAYLLAPYAQKLMGPN